MTTVFTFLSTVFLVSVSTSRATDYTGYCPPQCACFKYSDHMNTTIYPPNKVWVNCEQPNSRFRGYTSLPATLPEDTHSLDMSFNQITRLNQTDTIPTLSLLKLSTNTLQEVDKDAFVNLYNLQTLFLSYNNLSTLHSSTFAPLKNLTNLDLSNNRLSFLPRDIFAENENMIDLVLSLNPLLNLIPEWFTPLKKLEKLDLAGTKLYSIREETFHTLHNLRYLDLSTNLFPSVPSEALATIGDTLRVLKLNENRLRTLHEDSFQHLTSLIELQICSNELLTSIGSRAFSGLIHLQNLTIAENDALSFIHPAAFRTKQSQMSLRTLSLRGNHLTNLTLDTYPSFCTLDKLDLRSNPWNCDCNLKWVHNCVSVEGDPRCTTPHHLKTVAIPAMADTDFVCSGGTEGTIKSKVQSADASHNSMNDLKVARVLVILMAGTLLLVLGISIVAVLRRSDFIKSNVRRGNGSIYYVKAQSTPTGYLNDVPTGSLI